MVPFIAGGAGFWPSTVLARHTHLRIKTSTFWPILSEWLVSVSSQPRDKLTRNVQEPWSKATAKTVTSLHWALAALPFLGRCLTAISLDQWPWLRGWSGSPGLRDSRNTNEKAWKDVKAIVCETSCLWDEDDNNPECAGPFHDIPCLQISPSLISPQKKSTWSNNFGTPSPAMVQHL